MNLQDITAHVMIKNEAHYIGHVLEPLFNNLGRVIVCDTGSTDGTLELVRDTPVELLDVGQQTPSQLTACRNRMIEMTSTPWVMMVDGDELYPDSFFAELADYDVPTGKLVGFTRMCSVDYIGGYVLLDDFFNRLALYPTTARYSGDYPFESPQLFQQPGLFFYVESQSYAYHLHRLERSPLDHEVFMRNDKRFLFGMNKADKPAIANINLPLSPKYPDPYANLLTA